MVVDPEQSKAQREERVLMLMHILGTEAAQQIFPLLDGATTTMLKQRLPTMAKSPPSIRKQKQVLDEFERFFQFTKANTRQELRLHSGEEEEEETDAGDLELTGDPLQDIERMNLYQLAGALENEQPRTVALLMGLATPRRVAQVLELLPEARQELIIREMSHDPRAPEILLRRIAAITIERAKTLPTEPKQKTDPVFRMVEVLRATEKPKRRQIMKALEEQNPDQAALITQSLYQFEDLLTMDDSQIQKVLARVDSTTLSTALFGSDQRIIEKIMNNLSKRARASLQEELGFRKNVTGAQLRASRQLVTSAIAEAEQESE